MSKFKYIHSGEAEQFSFFRIPRALIKDERFRGLSTEAKLLYGLMLDRMGMSLRNGWLDEDDRVFIFYTLQEVQETLSCGHNKATRLFHELEQYGLIERIKQGQGKPAKIYVKNFAEEESPEQAEAENADLKTSKKSTCRPSVSKPLDCPEGAGIYTDKNYNDYSYTDPSIYPPTPGAEQPEIDRCDQREEIKCRIAYDIFRQESSHNDLKSARELIFDAMTNTASTIRIGSQVFSIDTVKQRFFKLNKEHITYVVDSLKQTAGKIDNIRAYFLTALFNAPVTIGPAVRHDFG